MMHISRCTSLKNDETTKRSWTAASAFLILMIVCFHLSFSSSFFFVGDNLRRCSFLCSPIFFLPLLLQISLAFSMQGTSESISAISWLGGWGWGRGWGWEGPRVTFWFILCAAVGAEKTNVWKSCIASVFVCRGSFWPVSLYVSVGYFEVRVCAIETDFFCISISISLFPFALSVVFFWRREVFLLLLIFFGRLDAGRDAFISRIDTVPLLLGRCPYSGWTRSWEWKPVDSVQKPG